MKNQTVERVQAMSFQQLDTLLCVFYREVRSKSGTPLKEHALKRLRSALTKYLCALFQIVPGQLQPFLTKSGRVFQETIHQQPSKSTEMLSRADCTLIRAHPALATDNPLSLLRKIWFELQIHFGVRRWSPREMWPDIFVFATDGNGRQYVRLDRDKIVASDMKVEYKGMLARRRMFARGGPHCPVAALKQYLARRETAPGERMPFLQTPNAHWTPHNNKKWYTATELTLSKNHNFVRSLCIEVKLATPYTNMSLCFGDPDRYKDCWP
jgi:hypothetical protein